MSTANQKQIAGDHYKTSYQHWDMLVTFGFKAEYFIGQFTKYLSRWHKKNGIRDIRKGQHFLEKLIELVEQHGRTFLPCGRYNDYELEKVVIKHVDAHLREFFQLNGVDNASRDLCLAVMFANSLDALKEAMEECETLVRRAVERAGVGEDKEKPVSTNFEFIEYEDEGGGDMIWRCRACNERLALRLDQPPMLHHQCAST